MFVNFISFYIVFLHVLIFIYIFRERKACWTLRGWKENDEDGNEYMVAEEIPKEKPKASKVRFFKLIVHSFTYATSSNDFKLENRPFQKLHFNQVLEDARIRVSSGFEF